MIQVFRLTNLTALARLALCALAFMASTATTATAQDTRIYRCGNEYTNNPTVAKQRDCKPMEGGNVTIVQGTRPASGGASAGVVTAPPSAARIDSDQQKVRDADARSILEGELRRTQARQAELQREYNNGEPERLGPETRNYQKYLDRVAELKAAIARNESDMSGIQRELSRLQNR